MLGTEAFPFIKREGSAGPLLQAARSLQPGRYAVALGVADAKGDIELRYAGRQVVARLPKDALRLSSVVLVDSLKPLGEGRGDGAFRIGGFEVVPRIGNVIKHGESLGVFYQVLGAGEGEVDLTISYQIHLKRGAKWVKTKPDIRPNEKGATQGWETVIVPQWPPTQYKLEIKVKDMRTGAEIQHSVPFTVVAQ